MAENKNNELREMSAPTLQIYMFVAEIIDTILKRIQTHKDPVIRYTLLLDKFSTMLELGFTSSTVLSDSTIPSDKYSRLKSTFDKLQKELEDFSDYIRTPHLNPDHPVGNNIMNSAATNFKSLTANLNKPSNENGL